MTGGSGIGTPVLGSPNSLTEFRTSILATLKDTGVKYDNTTIDEALRRVLNEYSRAFPDFVTATITLTASGRSVSCPSQTDLIVIITLIHPYVSTLLDPYIYKREDYRLIWSAGVPQLYFSGADIPQSGEKIYLEYGRAQKIHDLDSASATTVKLDHKQILITGAAGQAAMIRSQSLNEQWGGKAGEMPNLMQWGSVLYRQFQDYLKQIRQELNINPFTKSTWKLDKWDK